MLCLCTYGVLGSRVAQIMPNTKYQQRPRTWGEMRKEKLEGQMNKFSAPRAFKVASGNAGLLETHSEKCWSKESAVHLPTLSLQCLVPCFNSCLTHWKQLQKYKNFNSLYELIFNMLSTLQSSKVSYFLSSLLSLETSQLCWKGEEYSPDLPILFTASCLKKGLT